MNNASPVPRLVRESAQIVRIGPRRGFGFVDLVELWRYRELGWILAARDLKIRYKQTAIGVSWAVLQPMVTMGFFSVLFAMLGRAPETSNVPYPVSTFCALLPWQLCAGTMVNSAKSLVANADLVRKVYFPRVLIPIAPLATSLVDFAVSLPVLGLLMFHYGVAPTWAIVFAPVFGLLAAATAVAVGLWLSALNALYRDIQHAVPFLAQVWFFLSPTIYDSRGFVPAGWRAVLALNPMVGIIEGFRWSVLGTPAPGGSLVVSLVVLATLLTGGLIVFRRLERTFVDWI